MGRYTFFNTGFEYKFTFCAQSSYDIQEFGGEIVNCDNDDMTHQWTQEDRNNPIFQLLVSEIEFENYEKNLN
jgi:hypothetical protein